MKPVIIVEGISKRFSRRPNEHRKYGLRDLAREVLGLSQKETLDEDEFLAVDKLSFTLHQGEALALIGRNGCGKSTTLKMICGLLKPSSGTISVSGRIQPLISLGTGFNPMLTGRENIMNSAAIQGIGTKELTEITKEVIEFSELEHVIDSPISTYSSGMHARLGFSVAVHLKPEILVIDEILGVGDYAFQNKCFVKMTELQKQGVSIILVSHSHSRVIQMCDRAIWMHEGILKAEGSSKKVVNQYLKFLEEKREEKLESESKGDTKEPERKELKQVLYGNAIYDEEDSVTAISCEFENGATSVPCHSALEFAIRFTLSRSVSKFNFNIVFYRQEDGLHMTKICSENYLATKARKKGPVSIKCKVPDLNLSPGVYVILLAVFEGHSFLYRNVVKTLQIVNNDFIRFPHSLLEFDAKLDIEQC